MTLNDYQVNDSIRNEAGSVGTIAANCAAAMSASRDVSFEMCRLFLANIGNLWIFHLDGVQMEVRESSIMVSALARRGR